MAYYDSASKGASIDLDLYGGIYICASDDLFRISVPVPVPVPVPAFRVFHLPIDLTVQCTSLSFNNSAEAGYLVIEGNPEHMHEAKSPSTTVT